MSWQRPNIRSRMNREVHVRFWERAEVKFFRATRQSDPKLWKNARGASQTNERRSQAQHGADAFQSALRRYKTRPAGPASHHRSLARSVAARMGGALGSGAPRGNKNALKHGRFTRVAICGTRAHSRTGAAGAQ